MELAPARLWLEPLMQLMAPDYRIGQEFFHAYFNLLTEINFMNNVWFIAAEWMSMALVASLASVRLGISVAIAELFVGVQQELPRYCQRPNGRVLRQVRRKDEGASMFEKILIAYDGSAGSERALAAAVQIARNWNADLWALAIEDRLPRYAATVDETVEEEQ